QSLSPLSCHSSSTAISSDLDWLMRMFFLSFFFFILRLTPKSTLFPYTTLFRSVLAGFKKSLRYHDFLRLIPTLLLCCVLLCAQPDRKSTRLNSSHLGISYAVFCLKKKNFYHYFCVFRSV